MLQLTRQLTSETQHGEALILALSAVEHKKDHRPGPLEMGADVEDLGRAFEMPGRPPPSRLTSGSPRASALSDGPPERPDVTRLALF